VASDINIARHNTMVTFDVFMTEKKGYIFTNHVDNVHIPSEL